MREDRTQKENPWDRKVTEDGKFSMFVENMRNNEARFERPFHILLFFMGFCSGMGFILWILPK